ncbi:uncharacterized protein PHACADRAFT_103955 [Phanerochaete carnosa HHB-10118-sp]|uniref:Reverse transcriptase domain-containing protein n=1 Tax=Phanerochaete carnosa (strain HHB-10118-sp) TaxID=650164 RepID=K5VVR6_PHACS|nr:uncharacterized protein PHACADRAFT_103955 [Phanerochaete carnosa HHB-10118-sp]EKM50885.1 hypothetical protein PHACADRAFT_103955 [Phanerochaete carnosa HHB-10118-sp]
MLRQSKLSGFHIPSAPDWLIVTLFADDTTVYLSEYDHFSDLSAILDTWCVASGARFNVSKTEIIPIGTTRYRSAVITSR